MKELPFLIFLFGGLFEIIFFAVLWDISDIAKSLRIIVEELKKINK